MIERIRFIPKTHEGKIYCLTGPRGLFKFEKSLATILADWFNLPLQADTIFEVLSKSDNTNEWTLNLSGLKKSILSALHT